MSKFKLKKSEFMELNLNKKVVNEAEEKELTSTELEEIKPEDEESKDEENKDSDNASLKYGLVRKEDHVEVETTDLDKNDVNNLFQKIASPEER